MAILGGDIVAATPDIQRRFGRGLHRTVGSAFWAVNRESGGRFAADFG
jgi:hypothetical protein